MINFTSVRNALLSLNDAIDRGYVNDVKAKQEIDAVINALSNRNNHVIHGYYIANVLTSIRWNSLSIEDISKQLNGLNRCLRTKHIALVHSYQDNGVAIPHTGI